MNITGIDIKIIELGRWYIPRTSDIVDYDNEGMAFAGFGHYNIINIKSIERDSNWMYPMARAYNSVRKSENGNEMDFTSQRLVAFTNIYDDGSNTRTEVDGFWNENMIQILFMTMIHLEQDVTVSEVYKEVDRVFHGVKHLCYLTFDYSSVILFVQNMSFSEYLERVFQLNFEQELCNDVNGIKDTFSVFGINRNILRQYYAGIVENSVDQINKYGGKFNAVINISIQKLGTYLKLKEKLQAMNLEFAEWKMFGRHDISVTKDDIDLIWLFSVYRQLHEVMQDLEPNSAFFTYEVFMKTTGSCKKPDDGKYVGLGKKQIEIDVREKMTGRLLKKYSEIEKALMEIDNKDEYLRPIREVIQSISSISKNQFAEDFVLSMYESFAAFMDFVKMYAQKTVGFFRDGFVQFFGEYFHCLNSLISSAMHDERQFIQITAFNAVFFDIPPKMMAFYTAMTWQLQNIMRGDGEKKYYYLFTPYFTDDISVALVSQDEAAPADRIFSVRMNEKQLYNPQLVVRSMAHEIAHDVGDDKRLRSQRRMLMAKSAIYMLLANVLPECFPYDERMKKLISDIYEYCNRSWKEEDRDYLDKVKEWLDSCLENILEGEISDRIQQYAADIVCDMQAEDISEWKDYIKGILCDLDKRSNRDNFFENVIGKGNDSAYVRRLEIQMCWNDIKGKLQLTPDSVNYWNSIIEMISSVYRETFADLQMILLLNMNYLDYLGCFLYEDRLNLDSWGKYREDFIRITAVCRVMRASGFWRSEEHDYEGRTELKLFAESVEKYVSKAAGFCDADDKDYVKKLQIKVKEFKELLIDSNCVWKPERGYEDNEIESISDITSECIPEIDNLVYLYLIECLEKSVDCYRDDSRIGQVRKIQLTMKTISDFNNIEKVFEEIRTVIKEYKEYLLCSD